jgi:hypothetical protein
MRFGILGCGSSGYVCLRLVWIVDKKEDTLSRIRRIVSFLLATTVESTW